MSKFYFYQRKDTITPGNEMFGLTLLVHSDNMYLISE